MNAKSLNVQVSKGGQSSKYVELLRIYCAGESHVLRIIIVSDSYPEQCRAVIERWSGKRWCSLHYIPWPLMQTERALAYRREPVNYTHFMKDAAMLTKVACDILEVSQS